MIFQVSKNKNKTTRSHILIVDDEFEIREMLETYLSSEGYCVSTAADGKIARKIMAEAPIDLVIVDLGLPGEDGLSLTRYLREQFDAGIIILTGKGDTVDRIVGLEVGADDYIAKPFNLRELLARLKSIIRRVKIVENRGEAENGTEVEFAGWRLNLVGRLLHSPHGEKVNLTTGEFDLLAVMALHPHQVLSRDDLLQLTHHREAAPFDRTIDVLIARLRRKIETNPENPELIRTVRGSGYVFTPLASDSVVN